MESKKRRVRIIGPVSWVVGNQRVTVPPGDYDMSEVGIEDYELSRDEGPTFTLTTIEVGTYASDGRLKVVEGDWP